MHTVCTLRALRTRSRRVLRPPARWRRCVVVVMMMREERRHDRAFFPLRQAALTPTHTPNQHTRTLRRGSKPSRVRCLREARCASERGAALRASPRRHQWAADDNTTPARLPLLLLLPPLRLHAKYDRRFPVTRERATGAADRYCYRGDYRSPATAVLGCCCRPDVIHI